MGFPGKKNKGRKKDVYYQQNEQSPHLRSQPVCPPTKRKTKKRKKGEKKDLKNTLKMANQRLPVRELAKKDSGLPRPPLPTVW